jgi:hypothetical protein
MSIVERQDLKHKAETLERVFHKSPGGPPPHLQQSAAATNPNIRGVHLKSFLIGSLTCAVFSASLLWIDRNSSAMTPAVPVVGTGAVLMPEKDIVPVVHKVNIVAVPEASPQTEPQDLSGGLDPHQDSTVKIVHERLQKGLVNVGESTITGVVDSKSLTAAYYWTFVLKNDTTTDKEACINMRLPEDAVVSRATLWVNGIPQEAAFSLKQTVQQAYDWVVVKHRDPLLVTQTDRDHVKVQAAPVLAGGQMTIRLGFTAPVERSSNGKLAANLPSISGSNLKFACLQNIHIESDAPIAMQQQPASVEHQGSQYILRANLKADATHAPAFSLTPTETLSPFATRLTHTFPPQYLIASFNRTGQKAHLTIERVKEKPSCKLLDSDHAAYRLSALWAHKEIERLYDRGNLTQAGELANIYRLVSSVSGAVVLENEWDYQASGLNRDMQRVIGAPARPTTPVWQGTAPVLQGATLGAIGPGSAPTLQGATNGSIGPQAAGSQTSPDTEVTGFNTAGLIADVEPCYHGATPVLRYMGGPLADMFVEYVRDIEEFDYTQPAILWPLLALVALTIACPLFTMASAIGRACRNPVGALGYLAAASSWLLLSMASPCLSQVISLIAIARYLARLRTRLTGLKAV